MVHCKNCGNNIKGAFCENCSSPDIQGKIPPQQSAQFAHAPLSSGPKSNNKLIIIIIVALVMAIAIVGALSYIYRPHDPLPISTPRGAIYFSADPNVSGRFTGTFAGSINLANIVISLYDASEGETVVEEQPESGSVISIPNGCELTFTDVNANNIIDATDSLILIGGNSGDKIRVIYRPTGENVGVYTLN